jgi:soluble lytic murein transglycosylase-like protein
MVVIMLPSHVPTFYRDYKGQSSRFSMPIVLRMNHPAAQSGLEQAAPQKESGPVHTCLKKEEKQFHDLILRASSRHQVDPALIKAIIMAESGYNPDAKSRRGAKGLMQLMPRTAEALGVEDIFDPEHNVNAGVKYFKKLLKRFEGDVKLALAAYNAGGRNVREYGGVPPFKATRYFIKKVFEYYEFYREQMRQQIEMASSAPSRHLTI